MQERSLATQNPANSLESFPFREWGPERIRSCSELEVSDIGTRSAGKCWQVSRDRVPGRVARWPARLRARESSLSGSDSAHRKARNASACFVELLGATHVSDFSHGD